LGRDPRRRGLRAAHGGRQAARPRGQHRLDGGPDRLAGAWHLQHHEVRGGRPLRDAPEGPARLRHRGLGALPDGREYPDPPERPQPAGRAPQRGEGARERRGRADRPVPCPRARRGAGAARDLRQPPLRDHPRGRADPTQAALRAHGPGHRGVEMKFSVVEGWGKLPDGWTYREVAGAAVDKQDRACASTRGEHRVIVFDRDGNFLRSWGEGVVRRAHGITIDGDDMVWLTDDLHHTVRKFTPEGKHLLTIGDPDKPAELQGGKPFNRPTHVAICPKSGYLFVSDGYGNSRVHKYSPDGKHVMSWGEAG